jgi:predicted ATPase
MTPPITRICARNFRSLKNVDVQLAPLNVLIGPNGSGKTNLLNVLRFLATTVRFDLSAALDDWGGFDHIHRQADDTGPVGITIEGHVTPYSSANAPDSYTLTLTRRGRSLSRTEEFTFKRRGGQGRRITVSGEDVTIIEGDKELLSRRLASTQTTGLATLPKFSDREGGLGIRSFTALLSSLRVIEPDVKAARLPARPFDAPLAADASNLADALVRLHLQDPDAFDLLKHDLGRCLPGLRDILLVPVGGSARSVSVQLVENGLNRPIELADASFGTVRLLALLTALHEPDPPLFTAIEEVDHGLHPYALDILVDRMRAASKRTQILAATHSPTLVNRLRPEEIIICDRNPKTGESLIPVTTSDQIRASIQESDFRPGELWFSGALNGVPA